MNAASLIEALSLPSDIRLDQRVPKKLLLEQGAPTAADKRAIQDGIEELIWIAALKPSSIGVPEYRDSQRQYLEIAVLRLALRPAAKIARLVELVHRAVPYPLLLITEQGEQLGLSAAHKRWSQNEAGKTVLEDEVIEANVNATNGVAYEPAFYAALALAKQPHSSLHALYQGWVDTLLALQAARIIGTFTVGSNAEQTTARRDGLQESARLDTEVTRLRAAAAKEKQMARRVELNLELQRVQAAQAAARAKL